MGGTTKKVGEAKSEPPAKKQKKEAMATQKVGVAKSEPPKESSERSRMATKELEASANDKADRHFEEILINQDLLAAKEIQYQHNLAHDALNANSAAMIKCYRNQLSATSRTARPFDPDNSTPRDDIYYLGRSRGNLSISQWARELEGVAHDYRVRTNKRMSDQHYHAFVQEIFVGQLTQEEIDVLHKLDDTVTPRFGHIEQGDVEPLHVL